MRVWVAAPTQPAHTRRKRPPRVATSWTSSCRNDRSRPKQQHRTPTRVAHAAGLREDPPSLVRSRDATRILITTERLRLRTLGCMRPSPRSQINSPCRCVCLCFQALRGPLNHGPRQCTPSPHHMHPPKPIVSWCGVRRLASSCRVVTAAHKPPIASHTRMEGLLGMS